MNRKIVGFVCFCQCNDTLHAPKTIYSRFFAFFLLLSCVCVVCCLSTYIINILSLPYEKSAIVSYQFSALLALAVFLSGSFLSGVALVVVMPSCHFL